MDKRLNVQRKLYYLFFFNFGYYSILEPIFIQLCYINNRHRKNQKMLGLEFNEQVYNIDQKRKTTAEKRRACT